MQAWPPLGHPLAGLLLQVSGKVVLVQYLPVIELNLRVSPAMRLLASNTGGLAQVFPDSENGALKALRMPEKLTVAAFAGAAVAKTNADKMTNVDIARM